MGGTRVSVWAVEVRRREVLSQELRRVRGAESPTRTARTNELSVTSLGTNNVGHLGTYSGGFLG